MSDNDQLELIQGLCWYYDNLREITDKDIPPDKSHALAFEAGLQTGRHRFETERPVNIFKPKDWKP